MAKEQGLQTRTAAAGADLSAKQYFFVKRDSNGAVVVAGDGELADGILQNNPTSGQAACYAVSGRSKLKAGGTVAINALVASDSAGEGVTATTNEYINAKALEAGVDGQTISVELFPAAPKFA